MLVRPIFIITDGGIVLKPEGFDLISGYIKHFIVSTQTLIDEYVTEFVGSPDDPMTHREVVDMQREIAQAQQVAQELEQLRQHAATIYKANFVRYANVLRRTRIDLGLERIEDMYSLQVAMDHTMRSLKSENSKFSRERFVQYVNEGAPSKPVERS